MKTNRSMFLSGVVVASLVFLANEVLAPPFTLGNLVVVQVGDGSAALANNSTAAFLREYSISGGPSLQTIALPTAVSGLNQPLTLSGTATSEGFLTLSGDRQYLTMGGYGVGPGVVAPSTSNAPVVGRVVGRIDLFGNINTTTVLGDAYSGSNIRSAVSTDGLSLWTSGNAGSGLGGTAATRYTTLGATSSTQLHSTASNMRVANIFNGQLYVSSSTSSGGGLYGVATVGTGSPTTSGQAITTLPGMPTSGTHSAYDFWFRDPTTLYIADEGGAAAGGGIQKWIFGGSTWSLQYTLLNNGTTTTACRGLAGMVDGLGNTVLFATTGSALIAVTDSGSGATATTLATAPANTAFRGVELLIPEPSSAGLVLLGLAAWILNRKRQ
jgi:hypothetical protein